MMDLGFDTIEINGVEEYIREIMGLGDDYPELVYRGISKACSADGRGNITSSAYRRYFGQNRKRASLVDMYQYHQRLLEDVKSLNDESLRHLTDMQLIAHIQHTVGGTLLVDYSLNPLVSLWFSVSSDSDMSEDGFVYVLNNTDYTPVISQVASLKLPNSHAP